MVKKHSVISFAFIILRNHLITSFMFFVFIYIYLGLFKTNSSKLFSGFVISIIYFIGFAKSAYAYSLKRGSLELKKAFLAIIIASLPSLLLMILSVCSLRFDKRGFVDINWQLVLFKMWNVPFNGIYFYMERLSEKKHSLNILMITYIITTLLLPISVIIGYILGYIIKQRLRSEGKSKNEIYIKHK